MTTSTAKSSKSFLVQQTELGNAFYRSAMDSAIGRTIRLTSLDNALECYMNSLNCAATEDEEVSAMENIGMTSWKLAGTYLEGSPKKQAKNIRKYFKEALRNLCLAYMNRFCKSLTWSHALEESCNRCLKEATEWLATLDTKKRISGFNELLKYLPDCILKAKGYIQYSKLLINEGLTALNDGVYQECIRYMKECTFPIQEAERLGSQDPSIETEVNNLRKDVYTHRCTAERSMVQVSGFGETEENPSSTLSSEEREFGDTFFRSAEGQRSDMVKSRSFKRALQCYKKAYTLANMDEDLVSAAKKAANTSWRLATLKMATGCADQKVIHEYFKDALQDFGKAYPKRNCRGQAWAEHLEKSIQDCLHDIRTWIEPKHENDRIVALTEYLEYLPSCGAKVEGYLYIATIYFKKGKESLKFDEYGNCQEYLKDCRVPLGEAERMCDNVDPIIRLDVTALKKNVEYHEGLAKRYIARAKDAEARRERELAEAKEKIAIDQLKPVIKQLDLLSKLSIEDFVKQVYLLWPPRGTNETQPSLSSSTSTSSLKKLLIRAISHYHPDKVDKNVHGIKWQLLSCEITKCLNKRLEIIK